MAQNGSEISLDDKQTIAVTVATKKRLADLGAKGDTYEDIVIRLLEFYLEHRNGNTTH